MRRAPGRREAAFAGPAVVRQLLRLGVVVGGLFVLGLVALACADGAHADEARPAAVSPSLPDDAPVREALTPDAAPASGDPAAGASKPTPTDSSNNAATPGLQRAAAEASGIDAGVRGALGAGVDADAQREAPAREAAPTNASTSATSATSATSQVEQPPADVDVTAPSAAAPDTARADGARASHKSGTSEPDSAVGHGAPSTTGIETHAPTSSTAGTTADRSIGSESVEALDRVVDGNGVRRSDGSRAAGTVSGVPDQAAEGNAVRYVAGSATEGVSGVLTSALAAQDRSAGERPVGGVVRSIVRTATEGLRVTGDVAGGAVDRLTRPVTAPVGTLAAGVVDAAGVTGVLPVPGGAVPGVPGPADPQGEVGQRAGAVEAPATSTTTGVRTVVGGAEAGSAASGAVFAPVDRPAGHPAAQAYSAGDGQSPSPQPRPGGTAGQCVADSGSQRGGDAHAVAFAGGAEFGLVPGSGAAASSDAVRDRHRDILEFPG